MGPLPRSYEGYSRVEDQCLARPHSSEWNCPGTFSWDSEPMSLGLEEVKAGHGTRLTGQTKESLPTSQDGSSATVATKNLKAMGLAAGGKLGNFQLHCSLSKSVFSSRVANRSVVQSKTYTVTSTQIVSGMPKQLAW
jgi:hypothetical protein